MNLSYIDVNHPSEVNIDLLDSGQKDFICLLKSRPLAHFDKILYLNYPSTISDAFPSSDDIFLLQERTQSFLACLYQVEKRKIINNGFVFRWNKTVLNNSYYKRFFSKFEIELENDHSITENNSKRYPIVITQNKNTPNYDDLLKEKIFRIGKLFLIEHKLDWCVIFLNDDNKSRILNIIVDFHYLNYDLTKEILIDIL